MKNKFKLVLVGLLSLVLVTGCSMKENIHMDIKANKDVTISMTTAMDDELIDTMANSNSLDSSGSSTDAPKLTDEQRWKYLEESLGDTSDDLKEWTKEKYEKDGFKGYTFTSKTLKLDDLTGDKSSSNYDIFSDEKIDNAKLFIKNGSVYKSNFSGDMSKDDSLKNTSSYSSSMDLFEITFSVTLPTKPKSHNATKVSDDGKTLTWDLTKESDIQFEFSMGPNILLYAGIVVLVVVVIAVVVIIVSGTRKKKENVTGDNQNVDSSSTTENKPVAEPNKNSIEKYSVEEPSLDKPMNPESSVEQNNVSGETPVVEPNLGNVQEQTVEQPSPQEPSVENAPKLTEPTNGGSLQDMYNGNSINSEQTNNENVNNL